MKRIPSSGTTTGEVDRQLDDTAYDNVVIVKNSIAAVNTVADNIDAVITSNTGAAEIEIVATNIADVVTVADSISDVSTVVLNIVNVNAVGADLLEPTSEINTVATDIVNVNIVGEAITNVNTVATDIANVNTTAVNIADIITVANDLNEPVSEIETVAGSIVNVDIVGTGIANVNTVATNILDVDIVADNIASVSTVATDITNVNSVATTIVPNIAEILLADDNATIATTKAAEALVSADNAAASFDSFDDRYLGSKAVAPAVDNDGGVLLVGALYWDTAISKLRIWNGAIWSNLGYVPLNNTLTSTSTVEALTAAQGKVLNDRLVTVESGTVQEGDSVTLTGDVTGTATFDANGNVSVTTTVADDSHNHIISNVDGLQTILDSKQPLDATLTALAGVTTAADKYVYATASDTFTTGTITAFGRSLVDDADAATARTTLGISATNTPSTAVGGVVATNVQAAIQELDSEKVTVNTPIVAGTKTKITYDAKGLVTAGTTLAATDIPALDASKITTGTLPVLRGGTGVTTSTGTGSTVLSDSPVLITPVLGVATGTSFNSITGLASVAPLADGTAVVGTSTLTARQDHVHPTNFTATATDIKMNGTQAVGTLTKFPRADHVHPTDTSRAALASPTFTGVPAAPTAAVGTNTTQIATTAFVLANASEATWVANDARAKTALNAGGTAPIYACRAWVNFNGTGTVAIRASGNVSSITDNGTGQYTVNFTTAMPDENFCVSTGGTTNGLRASLYLVQTTRSSNYIELLHAEAGVASYDVPDVHISIFR